MTKHRRRRASKSSYLDIRAAQHVLASMALLVILISEVVAMYQANASIEQKQRFFDTPSTSNGVDIDAGMDAQQTPKTKEDTVKVFGLSVTHISGKDCSKNCKRGTDSLEEDQASYVSLDSKRKKTNLSTHLRDPVSSHRRRKRPQNSRIKAFVLPYETRKDASQVDKSSKDQESMHESLPENELGFHTGTADQRIVKGTTTQAALTSRALSLVAEAEPGTKFMTNRKQVKLRGVNGNHSRGGLDSSPYKFRGVALDGDVTRQLSGAGIRDNVTKISYMLYRLIKTHGVKSLIDIPCSDTQHWMPEVLHVLDLEVPGFTYYCVVPSEKRKNQVSRRFSAQPSPQFIVSKEFWHTSLPATDLAFMWNILGFISPQQSWQLLKNLRDAQTKYVILPNYPRLRNNPAAGTHHGRVNVRRAPYRFNEALRVFHNVSGSPEVTKQLLFYDLEHLRHENA